MPNVEGCTVMAMACGVNYPYIHSNNFEMNRFFFLLIRFEVNQSSHLSYALPNLIRDWRYLMLPNTTRNAFSQGLIDWSLNLKNKQTNKKQNNWLFTEVAKVAHEQFKWGFPMLVIPRVVCLQEWSQEEH